MNKSLKKKNNEVTLVFTDLPLQLVTFPIISKSCYLTVDLGPAFHWLRHFCLFSPKQTIRELFDMPLEEPSGSSAPSALEEEEETVASKQTHILEQVKKDQIISRVELIVTVCVVQGERMCLLLPG